MSEITYKITWSLYLEHEEIENSTDEFSQKNFCRLIEFLHLYNNCITCYFNGSTMSFACYDQESSYALIRIIHELANRKTEYDNQFTQLSLKEMSYCLHDDISTILNQNPVKPCEGKIITDNLYNTFEIKDILVNGPATIVFWADGTKTVVKCGPDDSYDIEKAVAMCFMKKVLGSRSMHKIFDLAEDKTAEYDNKFKRLEYIMPEDKYKE